MRRALCLLCCLLLLPSFLAFFAVGTDAQAYVYPEPEVLQIDLILQPSRYLRMIHSAEKQKYDAVVCMNEGEPQPIGVQVRGASSLREGLDMASKRIPMELCFDYADPDGTFRGNPSLKLINCLTPARLMTQLVAMQAFAFLDVPAPRITPAFIRINDTDFGLYLAVEDLNEAFVRNCFGGASSLYRPISEKDDRNSRTVYPFEWIDLVAKVDCGSNTIVRYTEARDRGEDAETFLDVDEFLRYMACEAFVMNDDGFLTGNRNFYLADDRGKLQMVAWDQDDVFTAFSEFDSLEEYERFADNNLCFRYLMQNETYRSRYRQYMRELNDGFLDPDAFLPWLENYIRVLAPYFRRDTTIARRSDEPLADLTTGNDLYNTLFGNLPLTFRTYHDQLGAQLSGGADGFSIPQGMTIESNEMKTDEEQKGYKSDGRSIIFRVCAGYWRLRRQAFLQNDGKATIWIGVLFALVFAATLICVYHPAVYRRRANHKSGGTTK